MSKPFALALDVETTGLDPEKHAVIEIGALVLNDRLEPGWEFTEPTERLIILPHEGATVDPNALRINGHHWVEDSKSDTYNKAWEPVEAWKVFQNWLRSHFPEMQYIRLVGWNIGFDLGFLKGMYNRIRMEPKVVWPFHYHTLDLCGICTYLDIKKGQQRRSYALQSVAREVLPEGYSSKFGAAHTALADTLTALEVLHAIERGS